MLYLTLDASSSTASVCIAQDETILYESYLNNGMTHSSFLMPMVEDALKYAGVEIDAIDVFGCVIGPGSFTGVRIGVATVMGLAGEKPCSPIDGLEALALQSAPFDGLICPMLDARAGQVYAATFENGQRLSPDEPIKLEELLERLKATGRKCLFTGDGAAKNRERLLREDFAVLAPESRMGLHASAASALAVKNTENRVTAAELRPLYLRPPQAERAKTMPRGNQNA